jgi:hypothetical protein
MPGQGLERAWCCASGGRILAVYFIVSWALSLCFAWLRQSRSSRTSVRKGKDAARDEKLCVVQYSVPSFASSPRQVYTKNILGQVLGLMSDTELGHFDG